MFQNCIYSHVVSQLNSIILCSKLRDTLMFSNCLQSCYESIELSPGALIRQFPRSRLQSCRDKFRDARIFHNCIYSHLVNQLNSIILGSKLRDTLMFSKRIYSHVVSQLNSIISRSKLRDNLIFENCIQSCCESITIQSYQVVN